MKTANSFVFFALAGATVLTAACDGDPTSATAIAGATALGTKTPADAATCPNGGSVLKFGVDDDRDGVLKDSEVDVTQVVCNGVDGLVGVTGATGATGDTGDTGATGATGDTGATGATGDTGSNGTNGTTGATGSNGTNGATGATGSNGTNGTNGATGTNAAFSQTAEYPGANCASGGVKLSYGADDNGNSTLDGAEVDGSLYVCNVSCGAYQCGGSCGTCSSGDVCTAGACVVNPPPTAGTSLNFTGSSGSIVVVNWAAASDDTTPTASLEYQVVYSTSNNITTLTDAEANGTVGQDWTANIGTATIGGLNFATTYYFQVLVRDGGGKKSVYISGTQTTAGSGSAALFCSGGQVMTGFGGRAGAIIDRIGIRCAPLVNGVPNTASTTDGANLGGMGGSDFGDFTCPTGTWVTGVSGDNGNGGWTTSMAGVGATCSDSSSSGRRGNAGDFPFSFSCPNGQKAVGLQINAVELNGSFYTGFMQGIYCR